MARRRKGKLRGRVSSDFSLVEALEAEDENELASSMSAEQNSQTIKSLRDSPDDQIIADDPGSSTEVSSTPYLRNKRKLLADNSAEPGVNRRSSRRCLIENKDEDLLTVDFSTNSKNDNPVKGYPKIANTSKEIQLSPLRRSGRPSTGDVGLKKIVCTDSENHFTGFENTKREINTQLGIKQNSDDVLSLEKENSTLLIEKKETYNELSDEMKKEIDYLAVAETDILLNKRDCKLVLEKKVTDQLLPKKKENKVSPLKKKIEVLPEVKGEIFSIKKKETDILSVKEETKLLSADKGTKVEYTKSINKDQIKESTKECNASSINLKESLVTLKEKTGIKCISGVCEKGRNESSENVQMEDISESLSTPFQKPSTKQLVSALNNSATHKLNAGKKLTSPSKVQSMNKACPKVMSDKTSTSLNKSTDKTENSKIHDEVIDKISDNKDLKQGEAIPDYYYMDCLVMDVDEEDELISEKYNESNFKEVNCERKPQEVSFKPKKAVESKNVKESANLDESVEKSPLSSNFFDNFIVVDSVEDESTELMDATEKSEGNGNFNLRHETQGITLKGSSTKDLKMRIIEEKASLNEAKVQKYSLLGDPKNKTASKIPGLSFVIGIKKARYADKEKTIKKPLFDCVICNKKTILLTSTTMLDHVKSSEHLMNVLELENPSLFETFKNDKNVSVETLSKALLEYEATQSKKSMVIATNATYSSVKKEMVQRINELKKKAAKPTPRRKHTTITLDGLSKMAENNAKTKKKNDIGAEVVVGNPEEFCKTELEKLVEMQKNRHPSKIVVLTDERDEFMGNKYFTKNMKCIRKREINFANALQEIKADEYFGKGTLFVFVCGIYSFVKTCIYDGCRKYNCRNPVKILNISDDSDSSDHIPIHSALKLHKQILQCTTQDKVLFCELVPISVDVNNSHQVGKRSCYNSHSDISLKKTTSQQFSSFLRKIDAYNKFVKVHSEALGFIPWNLNTNIWGVNKTAPKLAFSKQHLDKDGCSFKEKDSQERRKIICRNCRHFLNSTDSDWNRDTGDSRTKYDHIVVVGNPLYKFFLEQLAGYPKVTVLVEEDLKFQDLEKYMKNKESIMSGNILWLNVTGIYCIARDKSSATCLKNNCRKPIQYLAPELDISDLKSALQTVEDIKATAFSIIEYLKSSLRPGCNFVILPPLPPTVIADTGEDHNSLHNLSEAYPCCNISTVSDIAQLNTVYRNLTEEMALITKMCLKEIGISYEPISTYLSEINSNLVEALPSRKYKESLSFIKWKKSVLNLISFFTLKERPSQIHSNILNFIKENSKEKDSGKIVNPFQSRTVIINDSAKNSELKNHKMERIDRNLEILEKPETWKAINKPETLQAINQLETLKVVDKPETLQPINKPETLKVFNKPNTLKVINKPKPLKVINRPETLLEFDRNIQVTGKSETLRAINEPEISKVNYKNLEVISKTETLKDKEIVKVNLSVSNNKAPSAKVLANKSSNVDKLIFIGSTKIFKLLPNTAECPNISLWELSFPVDWNALQTNLQSLDSNNIVLFVILADITLIADEVVDSNCQENKCETSISFITLGTSTLEELIEKKLKVIEDLRERIACRLLPHAEITLAPICPRYCIKKNVISDSSLHLLIHQACNHESQPCILEGNQKKWDAAVAQLKHGWLKLYDSLSTKNVSALHDLTLQYLRKSNSLLDWKMANNTSLNCKSVSEINWKLFIATLIKSAFECDSNKNNTEIASRTILQNKMATNLGTIPQNKMATNVETIPQNKTLTAAGTSLPSKFGTSPGTSLQNKLENVSESSSNIKMETVQSTSFQNKRFERQKSQQFTKPNYALPKMSMQMHHQDTPIPMHHLETPMQMQHPNTSRHIQQQYQMPMQMQMNHNSQEPYGTYSAPLPQANHPYMPMNIPFNQENVGQGVYSPYLITPPLINQQTTFLEMPFPHPNNSQTGPYSNLSQGNYLPISNEKIQPVNALYVTNQTIAQSHQQGSELGVITEKSGDYSMTVGQLSSSIMDNTNSITSSQASISKINDASEDSAEFIQSLGNLKDFQHGGKVGPTFNHAFIIGKKDLIAPLSDLNLDATLIHHNLANILECDIQFLLKKIGTIPPTSVCFLAFDLSVITKTLPISPSCSKFNCQQPVPITILKTRENFEVTETKKEGLALITNRIKTVMEFVMKLSVFVSVVVLPLFPSKVFCENASSPNHHIISHTIFKQDTYVLNGLKGRWRDYLNALMVSWNNLLKFNQRNYNSSSFIDKYIETQQNIFLIKEVVNDFFTHWHQPAIWRAFLEVLMQVLVGSSNRASKNAVRSMSVDDPLNSLKMNLTAENSQNLATVTSIKVWNMSQNIQYDFFKEFFKAIDSKAIIHKNKDHYKVDVASKTDALLIVWKLNNFQVADATLKACIIGEEGQAITLNQREEKFVTSIFDQIYKRWKFQMIQNIRKKIAKVLDMTSYKTEPCTGSCNGMHDKCVYFHDGNDKRRNPLTNKYMQKMCSQPKSTSGMCNMGDACLSSHNIYEQMFYPTNFQSIPCPTNSSERKCDKQFCKFAHRDTPEMFYTNAWQDVIVYGNHSSIEYLAGAVRGISKLPVKKDVKVLLISPSDEFLDIAEKVVSQVAVDHQLKIMNLRSTSNKKWINTELYQVFLGTPSVVANYQSSLLSTKVGGAIIVDAVDTILQNDDRESLLKIFQRGKMGTFNSTALNKVFVAGCYDAKIAGVVSRFFGIPLNEVKESEPVNLLAKAQTTMVAPLERNTPITVDKVTKEQTFSIAKEINKSTHYKHGLQSCSNTKPRSSNVSRKNSKSRSSSRSPSNWRRSRRSRSRSRPRLRQKSRRSRSSSRSHLTQHLKRPNSRSPVAEIHKKVKTEFKPSFIPKTSDLSIKEKCTPQWQLHTNTFIELRQLLGPALYKKFVLAEKVLNDQFEEEYKVFKEMSELHPDYEVHYESFISQYPLKFGDLGEKHEETMWNEFWNAKFQEIKSEDWKKRRNSLLDEYKSYLTSPNITPGGNVQQNQAEQFSVEGTFKIYDELSDKLGMLGPALLAMVKSARQSGTLNIFTDPENQVLLKMVIDKFKLCKDMPSNNLTSTYNLAIDWTGKLLEFAKKPPVESCPLNLEAIAAASVGKDPNFVVNLLKTAFAYKGVAEPSKKEINDLFLKVCAIHFNLTVGK